MKKVLVFGGAGFIGSHLCRSLLGDGHHVICADNCITGNKENIQCMLDRNSNFEFIHHDVRERCHIVADEIYNLACPASPVAYQRRPLVTLDTSYLGMKNICKQALETDAKVLQASTSEVYGDPLKHPQHEQYWGNVNTIGPRSCYDEGKRIAETICYEYKKKGLDVRVARIFNTYGPFMAMDDGRLVSNLICQALQDKSLTIYGDGTQTRSLCYVSDMIRGLRALMECAMTFGPVNLGNPLEYSIMEIARTVIELTGSDSSLLYQKLPQDDPKRRKPDTQRAHAYLNWKPKRELRFGLQETISYFNNVLSEKKAREMVIVKEPVDDV